VKLFFLFGGQYRRSIEAMPEERTYSPEEIVHDCKLMEAIWEEIRNDLTNKPQLAMAYATCSTLADLIEIKLDHVENEEGESIWPGGTDRGYFLEKLIGLTSSFGELTEKVLANKDYQRELSFVYTEISKLGNALPNFQDGYKAFVRDKKLE
jgi:hypothetical protein